MNRKQKMLAKCGLEVKIRTVDKSDYSLIKKRLDSVSASFCPSKWNDAYLHLHNGKSHACCYTDTYSISVEDIATNPSALHNTHEVLEVRKEMLAGVRSPECHYCWKIEDLGGISPRIQQTKNEWSENLIGDILKDPLSTRHSPRNLEIGFSRTCNFLCSYCSPTYSSRWVKDIKENGALPGRSREALPEVLRETGYEANSPYVQAFEKWFPELRKSLDRLGITGGEPLLSPHTFRFLDYLNEFPAPQLDLSINSNLSVPRQALESLATKVSLLLREKKISSFKLYTSLDAYGERAEYIRHGLEWNKFWENMEFVLREIPNGSVGIMVTFNVLSVTSFMKFMEQVLEWRKRFGIEKNRITVNPSYLREPSSMSARIAPLKMRRQLSKVVEFMAANRNNIPGKEKYGFLQSELMRMESVVKWVQEPLEDPLNSRISFYRYFSEIDRRRGTSLPQVFPELADFWGQCQRESERELKPSPTRYLKRLWNSLAHK